MSEVWIIPYCVTCDFINDTKGMCFNCGDTNVIERVENE